MIIFYSKLVFELYFYYSVLNKFFECISIEFEMFEPRQIKLFTF